MATIVRDCPRCGVKKQTFDIKGFWFAELSHLEMAAVCRHCTHGTIFLTFRDLIHGSNIGTRATHEAIGMNVDITRFIYDQGFVSINGSEVQRCPEHVPPAIAAVFEEGAKAFSVGLWNASGAMFRAALDRVTKSLIPAEGNQSIKPAERQWLGNRLGWLFKNHVLPKDLEDLTHCIKEDGNDGVHDATLSKEDAETLQEFTVLILERVFTVPGRAEEAKKRRDKRRAPEGAT